MSWKFDGRMVMPSAIFGFLYDGQDLYPLAVSTCSIAVHGVVETVHEDCEGFPALVFIELDPRVVVGLTALLERESQVANGVPVARVKVLRFGYVEKWVHPVFRVEKPTFHASAKK